MQIRYRRTNTGYTCDDYNIYAFSLLELRYRVASALFVKNGGVYQNIYDDIQFVN